MNQLGTKKETGYSALSLSASSNKQRDVSNSGAGGRKPGNQEDPKKKLGTNNPTQEKSNSSIQVLSNPKLSAFSPSLNNNSNPQSLDISQSISSTMGLSQQNTLVNNSKTLSSSGISPFSGNNFTSMSTSVSISNSSSSASGNINVISRFRPLNEKEKVQSKELCVDFVDSQQLSIRSMSENNIYKFSFDRIFDMNSTQQEVYDVAAKPIIDSVLEGFNGTILAYGQTSSGKTHTMQGVIDNPEKEGIIPRMIRNVFNHILHSSNEIEFTVKVSMVEIYMEKIRDLIDQDRVNLNVREEKVKGIFIDDLSEHYVSNEEEVLELMKVGSDNRAVNATNMNDFSSRSHSIFIMSIHQNNVKDLVAKTGKLYLVDLAGSEKISKTGAKGEILEEAKTINKSLTTLGMVINNLTDNKSQYVPYRDSKLTRVLQESLGGNSKTCLIITCSPSVYNESETLSTLRFGLRAKKIKNKPKINKEVTVAELKLEIEKLGKILMISNQRINQLEGFIKSNNLTPPLEGDYSYEKNSRKGASNKNMPMIQINSSQINKKPERTISILEEEIKKLKDEDLIENENDNMNSVYFHTESKEITLNDSEKEIDSHNVNEPTEQELSLQDTIRELSAKYTDMMSQMSFLEEDKKDLNDKLENAIGKIKENSDLLEQKERIIEDLENAKRKMEIKEKELNEKIAKLKELLEIEKNTIKVSVDLSQDFEALNRQNIKNLKDNLMPSISTPFDDIYSKIQEVISIKEKSITETDHINNLQNLLDLMKIRLQGNSESERNSPNVTSNHIELNPIRDSVSTQAEETFRKERKKFETEKKLILKALEERAEKIVQVENDNKELRERIKLSESKMNPDDKNFVKKIVSLEKNLEQVNLMYHQVVTQKSVLKIENQVLEKKIKKRNDFISVVEKENCDLKEQLRMRDEKLSYYQKSYLKSMNVPNNVVKVIKGGSNKQGAGLTGDFYIQHSNSNPNSNEMVDSPSNSQTNA